MSYSVHNTQKWSFEALSPYVGDITKAMQKLISRYPNDTTVDAMWHSCFSGAKQLWLILDENDAFVAMAMTRTTTVPETGLKLVTMCDLAGRDFKKWWNVLGDTVEAWIEEQGAIPQIEGRRGWAWVAKRRGYKEQAVLFRKELA